MKIDPFVSKQVGKGPLYWDEKKRVLYTKQPTKEVLPRQAILQKKVLKLLENHPSTDDNNGWTQELQKQIKALN